MNLKINPSYIYIATFASFFFFWGINLLDFYNYYLILQQGDIGYFDLPDQYVEIGSNQTYQILSRIRLSYFILLLLIPIFYNFLRQKNSFLRAIFNDQKYIIFFILFIIAHFVLVKIYYHEIFAKSEIANLIYLLLLSIIYCHYRNIIIINFEKIITLYLIIFIAYSMIEGKDNFQLIALMDDATQNLMNSTGQCNVDLFLIDMLRKYLNISLSNSIYIENSHLAMMSIAVFFSCIYILVQAKKINILFLLLFLIEILIVLNNLSTTYFVCYFISQIVLLFFFFKKINVKFWIFTILLLSINSYLFFSDKNCTVKVTDFKVKDVLDKKLEKHANINLTTLVYKRSVILAFNTLKDHSLGWGIDGMDDATQNLMDNYETRFCTGLVPATGVTAKLTLEEQIAGMDEETKKTIKCSSGSSMTISEYLENPKKAPWRLASLNTKDGLSNFFKMFTEFGIFTFIVLFFFIKYILNIKNISSYHIFIIILFVTMCIRGVGYFNGGFIFCLLEFFYYKKFSNEFKN